MAECIFQSTISRSEQLLVLIYWKCMRLNLAPFEVFFSLEMKDFFILNEIMEISPCLNPFHPRIITFLSLSFTIEQTVWLQNTI